MTPEEAVDLLILARQFDNRIGAIDIIRGAEWADVLYDVSFTSAKIALQDFYRESTEKTIMPGNIRERARKIRAEHQAAIARSSRTVDQVTATTRELPPTRVTHAQDIAFLPVSQQRDHMRQRDAQRAEDVRRAREERMARCPDFAAAYEAAQAKVSQSPTHRKTWRDSYVEESPIQRARQDDPESMKSLLRVVSSQVKRAEDAA